MASQPKREAESEGRKEPLELRLDPVMDWRLISARRLKSSSMALGSAGAL